MAYPLMVTAVHGQSFVPQQFCQRAAPKQRDFMRRLVVRPLLMVNDLRVVFRRQVLIESPAQSRIQKLDAAAPPR